MYKLLTFTYNNGIINITKGETKMRNLCYCCALISGSECEYWDNSSIEKLKKILKKLLTF